MATKTNRDVGTSIQASVHEAAAGLYGAGLIDNAAMGDFDALCRGAKLTIVERLAREPEFAKTLLDEAATLFLNG